MFDSIEKISKRETETLKPIISVEVPSHALVSKRNAVALSPVNAPPTKISKMQNMQNK